MQLIRLSNEFIGPAVAYVSNRLLNFVSRVMKTSRNAAFKSDAPPIRSSLQVVTKIWINYFTHLINNCNATFRGPLLIKLLMLFFSIAPVRESRSQHLTQSPRRAWCVPRRKPARSFNHQGPAKIKPTRSRHDGKSLLVVVIFQPWISILIIYILIKFNSNYLKLLEKYAPNLG